MKQENNPSLRDELLGAAVRIRKREAQRDRVRQDWLDLRSRAQSKAHTLAQLNADIEAEKDELTQRCLEL